MGDDDDVDVDEIDYRQLSIISIERKYTMLTMGEESLGWLV